MKLIARIGFMHAFMKQINWHLNLLACEEEMQGKCASFSKLSRVCASFLNLYKITIINMYVPLL